jgi:hypothetical protein
VFAVEVKMKIPRRLSYILEVLLLTFVAIPMQS